MNGRVAKKIRKEALSASQLIDKELLERLSGLVAEETHEEKAINEGLPNFNPKDRSGKNYDEAYAMGLHDGAVTIARGVTRIVEDEISKIS